MVWSLVLVNSDSLPLAVVPLYSCSVATSELLDVLMARQDGAVAAALAQVREVASDMGGEPAEVRLPYWASQDDYMEHHYLAAEGDASWTEVNATTRRVAVMLRWLGYDVRWVDGADNPVPRA